MSKLIFLADVLRYIWRAVEPLMSWMGVRGCRSLKRIFGIVWKGLDARIGQGCILGLAYIRWSDPPRWPEPRHSWPNPHPGTSTTIMARRMICMVGSLLDFWEIKHVSPNTCFCFTPRPDSACDICVFFWETHGRTFEESIPVILHNN